MIFNKERRLKYLGFNDFWFASIGIIILGFVTDYLFNNSFARYPLEIALINWSVSLFFSMVNWFVLRLNLILLRKIFPALSESIKRILIGFCLMFITVLVVDYVGNIALTYGFGKSYNPIARSKVLLPVILISTMVYAIYEAIYFFFRLQKSIRDEEQAKQVIVQAQLDALNNQAKPHFLFNSLNTLRDIIDQNSKADAKKFVDKLSNVYRFILDARNANLIPLADELKFAQSYIHIQSERFGENLKLNWDIPASAESDLIVPMSLQLLLENAIKHNVISKSKPLLITVSTKDNHLVVDNKIQLKSTQLPSTKLGLKNIEKRYLLIANKSPIIQNDGQRFSVSIPLLKVADQKQNYENINH